MLEVETKIPHWMFRIGNEKMPHVGYEDRRPRWDLFASTFGLMLFFPSCGWNLGICKRARPTPTLSVKLLEGSHSKCVGGTRAAMCFAHEEKCEMRYAGHETGKPILDFSHRAPVLHWFPV